VKEDRRKMLRKMRSPNDLTQQAQALSPTSTELPPVSPPTVSTVSARSSVVRKHGSQGVIPTMDAERLRVIEADRIRAKAILDRPDDLRAGKVWMTEGMWAFTLSPAAFASLRERKFEKPFAGEYSSFEPENSSGLFKCAGCKLPVFAGAEHCGDGTRGYATFRSAIAGSIEKKFNAEDSSEIQYFCIRCEGFLGVSMMTGFNDVGVNGEIKVSSPSIHFVEMAPADVAKVLRECAKREDALSPTTISRRGSSSLALSRRSSSAQSGAGVGDDATPNGLSNRQLSKKLSRMASRQATADSAGGGTAALVRRLSSR